MDFGSTFHSEGGGEDDHLEDSNFYVDLGEDSPDELKKAVANLVEDARNNGLSDAGSERLTRMLRKYPIFGFGWEKPRQPTYRQ